MMRAVQERGPDVVVLDYALGRGDGLSVCFRLKQRLDPPAVVLYSGYADHVFAVPAVVAQADAIVPKSAPVGNLLDAIRRVAAGQHAVPRPDPEVMQAASSRLRGEDLPVVGLLLARVPAPEIAETLDTTLADVRAARTSDHRRDAGDRPHRQPHHGRHRAGARLTRVIRRRRAAASGQDDPKMHSRMYGALAAVTRW